jgi:hypothetical protein
MDREITAKNILTTPPADVDFALQKGRGTNYEPVQIQRSGKVDLEFQFPLNLKTGRTNQPDFSGPFVQGPPNERFVYIDIGSYAGQTNTQWSRRLKIPLNGITMDMVNAILNGKKGFLITHVPGTGRDGGPNCATVKPFDGWKTE